jgi:hypothetical protein
MYRAHGVSTRPLPRRPPPAAAIHLSRGLSNRKRINIVRFLLLGWHPELIAARENCGRTAVYNVMANLKNHESTYAPL